MGCPAPPRPLTGVGGQHPGVAAQLVEQQVVAEVMRLRPAPQDHHHVPHHRRRVEEVGQGLGRTHGGHRGDPTSPKSPACPNAKQMPLTCPHTHTSTPKCSVDVPQIPSSAPRMHPTCPQSLIPYTCPQTPLKDPWTPPNPPQLPPKDPQTPPRPSPPPHLAALGGGEEAPGEVGAVEAVELRGSRDTLHVEAVAPEDVDGICVLVVDS